MKHTKSGPTALARLIEVLAKRGIDVTLKKTGTRGHFSMSLARPGKKRVVYTARKAAEHLATLADLAVWPVERGGFGMTYAELADAVRMHGAPHVTEGWREETLAALSTLSPRGKREANERTKARKSR